MGIGVGAGFPLGLAAIAWRAPDATTAAATSGLALGVGYTTAGLGPVLMGVLIDVTGGYVLAITLLVLAGLVQAWAILVIGDRPRYTGSTTNWNDRRRDVYQLTYLSDGEPTEISTQALFPGSRSGKIRTPESRSIFRWSTAGGKIPASPNAFCTRTCTSVSNGFSYFVSSTYGRALS